MKGLSAVVANARKVFSEKPLAQLEAHAAELAEGFAQKVLAETTDAAACDQAGHYFSNCDLFTQDQKTKWLLAYGEKHGKLLGPTGAPA